MRERPFRLVWGSDSTNSKLKGGGLKRKKVMGNARKRAIQGLPIPSIHRRSVTDPNTNQ